MKEVKRDYPDRALIASLMVPCVEEAWKKILPLVEETGADGVELNFGCPHGMSERGMGAAVGQVPEYIEMVTRWVKQYTRMPCIVKLTPNITDILKPAEAALKQPTISPPYCSISWPINIYYWRSFFTDSLPYNTTPTSVERSSDVVRLICWRSRCQPKRIW